MSTFHEHYATFANFGGGTTGLPRGPQICSVTVPESIKRRLPSKHYVYKIVVQWSNGSTSVVYRRYSMFFDFMIKLQELYTNISLKNPKLVEHSPQLPDLPGRVLFGRSEIHQVAEKRRGKIEEFCQHLISLPPEISESSLVLGFFNTWPDDTTQHADVSTSPRPHSPLSFPFPTSPLSPKHTPSFSATDAIITHPDEMENLEQYRVVADYQRKDSHQVDLNAGQIVHVIEKHDTGWWMVMAEDEQGYAPAAYLESLEDSNEPVHPENHTSEEYEAMESYKAENEDEVGFKSGDRIEVLSKSMDGWWKIKCNGKEGFCPAALIRKNTGHRQRPPTSDVVYESEKSIYEGLNIHRPPPRRNTISRPTAVTYDIPRPNPALTNENIYVDPASESDSEEDMSYYKVPKPLKVLGGKGKVIRQQPHMNGSRSISISPPEERTSREREIPLKPQAAVPVDESPYEMDTSLIPIYQNAQEAMQEDSPVYENTQFQPSAVVPVPVPVPPSPPPPPPKPIAQKQAVRPSPVPQPFEAEDYVDLDSHDEYVNPDELRRNEIGNPPAPAIAFPKPVSQRPPPLPTSDPPKTRPKLGQRSFTIGDPLSVPKKSPLVPRKISSPALGLHSMEEEYIEMDPIYAEVPPEDDTDQHTPLSPQNASGRVVSPARGPPPPPPPPYAKHKLANKSLSDSSVSKPVLTRTKSLEDLLSSSPKECTTPPRQHSPPNDWHNQTSQPPARVPLLPPHMRENTQPAGGGDMVLGNVKPRPAKYRAGKARRANGDPGVISPPELPPNEHSFLNRSTRGSSPHRPLMHTISEPSPKENSHSVPATDLVPKTYVAVSDYTSQAAGCLSFSQGDKCVVLQKTRDGWWLVNMGGREGWTPRDFWQEERRIQAATMARPPTVAPQRLPERKPRSHTVGDVFHSSSEFSSSMETSLEDSLQSHGSVGFTTSLEGEKSPLSGSVEMSRPAPPPLPPINAKLGLGKSKVPPPPKPKPLLNARRNVFEKPSLPQRPMVPVKPSVVAPTRASTSPPGHQNNSDSMTPSPPPLPAARRKSPPYENGDVYDPQQSQYARLEEARTTLNPIETAPWFVGKMERVQAEQFLMEHGRQREFLVRERTARDGYYALSIRYHYSFKHFNIDPTGDGQYAMGTLIFPSIDDIIHHYQQNSLFIHDGQHVTLGQPVKRKNRPSDATKSGV